MVFFFVSPYAAAVAVSVLLLLLLSYEWKNECVQYSFYLHTAHTEKYEMVKSMFLSFWLSLEFPYLQIFIVIKA